jgi:antitoxin ParD1/3/4
MRMSKLERITVTMPEEMAAKLRAAVEAGEYATTSEVVREALRRWSEKQDRIDAENQAIREALDRAQESGTVEAADVYRRLREHVANILAENSDEQAA